MHQRVLSTIRGSLWYSEATVQTLQSNNNEMREDGASRTRKVSCFILEVMSSGSYTYTHTHKHQRLYLLCVTPCQTVFEQCSLSIWQLLWTVLLCFLTLTTNNKQQEGKKWQQLKELQKWCMWRGSCNCVPSLPVSLLVLFHSGEATWMSLRSRFRVLIVILPQHNDWALPLWVTW